VAALEVHGGLPIGRRLDGSWIALLKLAVEFTQNPMPSLFARAFHLIS
jgi:hypothetical protein